MTFTVPKNPDKLFFIPLGGSNEIGMNFNCYSIDGKWLIVDCGIGFANESLPGVDIIVPDIDFLLDYKDDIVGMLLTHAHEDHIGAVAHLYPELECPIYTTSFTAALLKRKFIEAGIKGADLNIVEPESELDLGPFHLDLIGVTHSIPEMQAVAITTKVGIVMHTGDWKFDDAPQVGPASNYDKLKAYGDKGVLACVCDSTNVMVDGHSGSEETVREHLTDLIKQQKNRVVVTTFASNISRLDTILKAAHEAGRSVCLAGRSMHRMMETAHEAGYLTHETQFISDKEASGVPRKDLLILCTGCQGETRAALTRMANDSHPTLSLNADDTVIMSSRKIPGNEVGINKTVNTLVRKGVEVITDKDFYIHVSGHPAREELKKMYDLVRPQVAIPTHGEAQHLHEHCKFALECGAKQSIEMENGKVVELTANGAKIVGQVQSGYIAIDGGAMIPTDGHIIKDRRRMQTEGVVFVSCAVDSNGTLISALELAMPGLLDPEEDAQILEEYTAELTHLVEHAKRGTSPEQLKDKIRKTIRSIVKRELDKRPLTIIQVVVGEN